MCRVCSARSSNIYEGDHQGGSSLTQRYVKNVLILQAQRDDDPIAQYHASEDTIARKDEMLISVQMEKQYSKPEILRDISISHSLAAIASMACRRLRSGISTPPQIS